MTTPARVRRRWSPLLLVVGLVVGWVAGIVIAWSASPFTPEASTLADLKPELQSRYVELISAAYALDGDIERARERLIALDQGEPGEYAARVAEAYVDAGSSLATVRQIARLAQALGGVTPRLMAYLVTPVSPSATPSRTATLSPTTSPSATLTLPPSRTPSATPSPTRTATPVATETSAPTKTPTVTPTGTSAPATYALVSKQSLCIASSASERIAIYVQDESSHGVPGVRVIVTWPKGEESLYTGLKPEVDSGYADFVMTPGIVYTVRVGIEGSDAAENLSVTGEPCPDAVGDAHREWKLTFRRRH